MIRFILQRLLSGLLVVLGVVSLTFILTRNTPGSPFAREREMPEYVRQNLERLYGLDKPMPVQLGKHIWNMVTLDFPVSTRLKGWTVRDILAQGMPVSLTVGGLAFLIAIGIGIPGGALAAMRPGRVEDRVTMLGTTLGICVPSLVLGPLMSYYFGLKLKWFNVAGWYDPDDWVLPSTTLGLICAAAVARLTRGGLREALTADHIRTARAKGVGETMVVFRHAFKQACIPLLNYLGPLAAGLIGGSFVTETVFQLPGLGRHFINSALHKDYTVMLWLAAFFAILVVGFNLLVDILQAWLNPRIRISGK